MNVTSYEKAMMPHRKKYISMYHVIGLKKTGGIKNVTPKAAKKFVDVAVYRKE